MNDGSITQHRTALVLYGSETGNAHDIAEELARTVERLRFTTDITCLDDIEVTTLKQYTIVLIAISTTGQGDLPNNARLFWAKLLRKKLSSTHLKGVCFTAFGLGDTSYPKYNWAVRKLQKRLIQLGATELVPHGEGNEQHPEGYDAAFHPWLHDLRELLLVQLPLDSGLQPIPDDYLLPPRKKLTTVTTGFSDGHLLLSSGMNGLHIDRSQSKVPIPNGSRPADPVGSTRSRFEVLLEENKRVTPTSHWQDVRHLIFSTEEKYNYKPGDILTIYPENNSEDVDHIINLMKWQDVADQPIQYETSHTTSRLPNTSKLISSSHKIESLTLRALLSTNLDLNAIPRRSFFAFMAHFTNDEFQKNRLLEFTKFEFLDELYDYTTRPRRSILEVLQEFDTVKIPWQWAATVLPELRGRQFSIASGGDLKYGSDGSTHFELLIAIVKYKTVIKKIRQGVCTRYLASLKPGTRLQVSLQRGDLGTKSSDATRPVVMIGPGTGVAPMRSLIWERYRDACAPSIVDQKGDTDGSTLISGTQKEMVLFFGCRNKDADYFFENEWHDLQQKLPLKVFAAFSREQRTKVYVQDIIIQQRELVFRLLYESQGIVYVCGSSGKMPQAVREALIEAFQQAGILDRDVAEEYLVEMEKKGRYRQETW